MVRVGLRWRGGPKVKGNDMKVEGRRLKDPAARRRRVSATVVKTMGVATGGEGGAAMARRVEARRERES